MFISVISFQAAKLIGVMPLLSGALGLSDNGANVLMISRYPLIAAQWIGVNPSESGVLGFSASGANILTISRWPCIGVNKGNGCDVVFSPEIVGEK